jgi:uncharacterized protein (DUF2236 family)
MVQTMVSLQSIRSRLALEVTGMIVGDRPPSRVVATERDADATASPGAAGYFGPDSVTWAIHADSCMLAGGLRALMLQTMHPLAMAGIAQHSNYRDAPLDRLANTSLYVGTTIYGSREQARQAIAMVKRVHERVTGFAPDGRPYAANDPHLLTWVHSTLVDSFLRAYQRYGSHRLSAADADRYVAEQAVLAELFGAEPAARSVAELRSYFTTMRPELAATRDARETIRFLLAPPLPLIARGPYAVIASAAVTMLPRSVRRSLWLPVLPAVEPLVVRPAATALVRTVDWVLAAHPALTDAHDTTRSERIA